MSAHTDYNNYLLFNPEGRIPQLEYIQKTTELGNTCLALCNGRAGVLIAHVPRRTNLAKPQEKVFSISEKALFAFSGVTNDGLGIVKHLKGSAIYEDVMKDRDFHYLDVFEDICIDAAYRSFDLGPRLYGAAGVLLMESEGIHAVEFNPAGMVKEVRGIAIGHRAQSCNTVLEEACGEFEEMSLDELVRTGVRALANAHPDADDGSLLTEDVYIHTIEAGQPHRRLDTNQYMG